MLHERCVWDWEKRRFLPFWMTSFLILCVFPCDFLEFWVFHDPNRLIRSKNVVCGAWPLFTGFRPYAMRRQRLAVAAQISALRANSWPLGFLRHVQRRLKFRVFHVLVVRNPRSPWWIIKDFLCKVYIELLLSIRLHPHRGKFIGLPEQNFSWRKPVTNLTHWDAQSPFFTMSIS